MVFYKEAYVIVTTLIEVLLCASKRIEVFYFHVFSLYRWKVLNNTSASPIAAKHVIVLNVSSVINSIVFSYNETSCITMLVCESILKNCRFSK